MSDNPEFKFLETIKDGDIVVLKFDTLLSNQAMKHIHDMLIPFKKRGIEFLILDKTANLEKILRKEKPHANDD